MSVRFEDQWEDVPDEEPQKVLSISEEYQLWRQNCPTMYEFVSETALTWPSLTVQWMPDAIEQESNGIPQRLIIGTHTSGEDTDYLKIASTNLPQSLISTATTTQDAPPPQTKEQLDSSTKQHATNARLKVTKKLKHELEVNRARYNPFKPNNVATISGSGDVYLYDVDTKESPIHLKHHTANGFGLSWNPLVNGQLLSSSDDKTVALWDTVASTDAPAHVYTDHTDIVNDVQWHNKTSHIFGSVSDDHTVRLYDTRTHTQTQTLDRPSAINTIAFSKHSSNLYAIGLEDSTIELFDLRNPTQKLHTIMGHTESITCLQFDPHNDGLLASGSNDRRVILWDIAKIGEEQVQEDEDDGCPELFMMHAGHTAPVMDLSFNTQIPFLLASTADDNIVHLWKISKKLTDEYTGKTVDDIDVFALE